MESSETAGFVTAIGDLGGDTIGAGLGCDAATIEAVHTSGDPTQREQKCDTDLVDEA